MNESDELGYKAGRLASQASVLANELRDVNVALNHARNRAQLRLIAAQIQLGYVWLFLDEIPEVRPHLKPLQILMSAIGDVLQGHRHPMFEVKKIAHRPASPGSYSWLKMQTADCVEKLCKNGMSREASRKFVATQWKKLGVRQPTGKLISVKLIESWEGWVRSSKTGASQRKVYVSTQVAFGFNPSSIAAAKDYVARIGRMQALQSTWQDRLA